MRIYGPIVTFLFFTIFSGAMAQSPNLHFDGVDDYVNLGPDAGNNVRTVEFWFKLDQPIDATLSSFQMICMREVNASNTNEWHVSFTQVGSGSTPGALRFAIIETVGAEHDVESNSTSWNANQWYHVAGVVDPVQGMMLFIDGVLQTDQDPTFTDATAVMPNNLELGRQTGFSRYFNGTLDDFHLTTDALYTSNFTPPCPDRNLEPSTQGLWNFNTGSGLVVYDASPNNNDGTINGATWGSDIICPTNTALYFDGVDDYVNLGPDAGNNVRTVEFWFKLDQPIDATLSSFQMICMREVNASNTNEWHVSFTQTGSGSTPGALRFAIIETVGAEHDVESNSTSWNANQWYHVAGVVDPVQGMMLFIDGVLQTDQDPTFTDATAVMPNNLELGRQTGFSRYFNGTLDDFHLTTDALYTSNFTPPCPDRNLEPSTQGLWNFNTGSGLVAYDASANNFDGTVNGAIWVSSFTCGPNSLNEVIASSTKPLPYPNPTNGQLQFNIPDAVNFTQNQLLIYSHTGQLIYSENNIDSSTIINLSDKSRGIYFYVFVDSRGHQHVGKIVKG